MTDIPKAAPALSEEEWRRIEAADDAWPLRCRLGREHPCDADMGTQRHQLRLEVERLRGEVERWKEKRWPVGGMVPASALEDAARVEREFAAYRNDATAALNKAESATVEAIARADDLAAEDYGRRAAAWRGPSAMVDHFDRFAHLHRERARWLRSGEWKVKPQ